MNSKFLVPASIIVAGIFIAGAVYLGGAKTDKPTVERAVTPVSALELAPVTERDFIRGSRIAPVVVVEYSDIECPFCKVFHATMKNILSTYEGKVAWVYRHYPIVQLHKKAIPEAIATECAAEQGGNSVFWEYLDRVFEATNSSDSLDLTTLPVIAEAMELDVEEFNTCLTSGKYDEYIRQNIADATKAGARGTPYSILVLATPLTNNKINAMTAVVSEKGYAPDTIVVSDDKRRVAIGGALPLDFLKDLINIILR
jgi:protein-disulfide isomerase